MPRRLAEPERKPPPLNGRISSSPPPPPPQAEGGREATHLARVRVRVRVRVRNRVRNRVRVRVCGGRERGDAPVDCGGVRPRRARGGGGARHASSRPSWPRLGSRLGVGVRLSLG